VTRGAELSGGGALVPSGGAPPLPGGPVGGSTRSMADPHRAQRAAGNMALIITLAVLAVLLAGGGVIAATVILVF
jgi:hypothetical protein